ncbi:MAG: ABC transporter permease [Thermodesulfovibrionales bacterium]|nr:ABC transporter permease [Thermodesulfovibrionales bacterium]
MFTGHRERNILEFTLSSLLRRRGKHLALVVIYTALVFLLASVMFFAGSIREEASIVLRSSPEIILQKMIAGRQDLVPMRYAEVAEKIRGVQRVSPRLWGYYYSPATKSNYTLMVPDNFSYGDGHIVIGNGIARVMSAAKGDRISLLSPEGDPLTFIIAEVMDSRSELISSDLMLVSEGDFRELFDMPEGYVTDLALSVKNEKELSTIARKLSELLPGTRPVLRDEILRTYDAVFNWRAGLMITLLGASVFAFAIFAWDRASGLSAEERREIGILKAVGWETSDIILMKFWEGAVISLSSFLMGMVFAYLHVYFTSGALFWPVLKGWSVLYPEFRLLPHVDLYSIFTLFFLTVVPYTLITIIPSWRTATMDPDEVMRA